MDVSATNVVTTLEEPKTPQKQNLEDLQASAVAGCSTNEPISDPQPSTSSGYGNPKYYRRIYKESPFKNYLTIDPELLDLKKTPKTKPTRPSAVSGNGYYIHMQKKLKEKAEEQKRKEMRQKEREEKRKQKENIKQKKTQAVQSDVSEDGEEIRMIMDDSDVVIGGNNEDCAACGGNEESENVETWIGCSDCFRWFHKYCIEGGYDTMSLEELKEVDFSCNICLKKKK